MEITGKIIAALPERSGVSARSGAEWRLASYVLETMEQYPRKMCFEVFGSDRIQQLNIQVGETMIVSFDIDAREFHRQDGTVSWFNSIRAWKVERNLQAAAQQPAAPAQTPFGAAPQAPIQPPFTTDNGAPTAAPQPAAQPSQPSTTPFGAAPAASGDGDDLPF